MQIPCVYIPGPAPAVSVANTNSAPKCFAVPVFKYIPVHGGRGGGLFAAGIKAPSPGYVSSEASPSPL